MVRAVAGHDTRPAVIFVHGYYGSALGARPSPALEVEGLFGSVAVLPFLYGITIYSPMMDSLSRGGANQVVAYSYDWRQDLQPAAAGLAALVESLRSAGAPRVSIVAHSMGGLVTSYYLGYGAQPVASARLTWEGARSVAKVVFLGTPFRGAISILRNMQHGTGYPWNKDLLEPATISSWGASYHLLPFLDDKILGEDGHPHGLRLAQASTWENWKLGYHRLPSPSPGVGQARGAYVKQKIDEASRFLTLVQLKGAPAPAGLRVLNVTGEGKPTLAKGYAVEGRHECLFLESDMENIGKSISLLQEDGDGTVPLSSAALPPGLEPRGLELRSNFAHDKLFLDPKIEKEYQQFLEGV